MNVDPYSSDSSSWSLVDVEDNSDSELDSIGGNLVVESVHDSEVESESDLEESGDEVDVAEEALEEHEVDQEALNDAMDEDEEVEKIHEEQDSEVEEDRNSEIEDDSEIEEDPQNEDENLEILEESEAMEEAAAKHYVEPGKVVQKLEELSKSADSPFDKFVEKISMTDNARSLAFIIIVLATLMGAGLGHYIGACLIGDQYFSMEDGSFCLESEKSHFLNFLGNPGLQYQEFPQDKYKISEAIFQKSEFDPLVQCKEKLDDANAQVKMKQGVNKYVRESYKQQLQRAKEEFEARLALYKRASRQLLAKKYAPSLPPPSELLVKETQKNKQEINNKKEIQNDNGTFAPICSLAEGRLMNLTKSIFFSFSNWTSHQPVVRNLIKYSPSFDESLERVSSWIRNSKSFNNVVNKMNSLAKLPQFSNAVFDTMPTKVKEFMKSDLRNLATKAITRATTALTETNFSSLVSGYSRSSIMKSIKEVSGYHKSKIVSNIRQQVKSALNQLKNFSLSKISSDVCFLQSCNSAFKLATAMEKNSELIIRIGKKRVEEYVRFLKSLSIHNCSKQIQCEKDWWMGCGPQFLDNCSLQQWQEKRFFSGAGMMNRRQDMKQVAIDLGWIEHKNRRSPVRCPRLSNTPLPCPAPKPLPSLLPDSLAPCHSGPNSAKPCHSTTPLPRPCPINKSIKSKSTKSNKVSKPTGDGRPDWSSQRAQVREKQRVIQSPKPSKKPGLHQRRTHIFSKINP